MSTKLVTNQGQGNPHPDGSMVGKCLRVTSAGSTTVNQYNVSLPPHFTLDEGSGGWAAATTAKSAKGRQTLREQRLLPPPEVAACAAVVAASWRRRSPAEFTTTA